MLRAMNAWQLPRIIMHIPDRFEFHYVQNGVKKSVTLLTEALFKQPINVESPNRSTAPRTVAQTRTDVQRPTRGQVDWR